MPLHDQLRFELVKPPEPDLSQDVVNRKICSGWRLLTALPVQRRGERGSSFGRTEYTLANRIRIVVKRGKAAINLIECSYELGLSAGLHCHHFKGSSTLSMELTIRSGLKA